MSDSGERRKANADAADDVYPTTLLDNHPGPRARVLAWTLRFNDVLDPSQLHDSLAQLVATGDWRKLGGRLRQGKDRKLELHVPKTFTKERPAVTFTHQAFAAKLDEHPLARRLPTARSQPCVLSGPAEFRAFAARPGAPTKLQDFLDKDIPQLSLHITSFQDATLVALSWHHAVMDAMGQRALLHGWSLMLAGQQVPPVTGAHEDVLYKAAGSEIAQRETLTLEDQRLKGFRLLRGVLWLLWDTIWNRDVSSGTVFLPSDAVAKLCARAREDLDKDAITDSFISEGDVLVAWCSRMVALSRTGSRPINVITPIDVRPRLPGMVDPEAVYIQNMLAAAQMVLTTEAARGPLGRTALAHRRVLKEQATTGQLLAFLRTTRQLWDDGGNGMFACMPPSATLLTMTNWTKADFCQTVDFGPAVIKQGEDNKTRRNKLGTMVYHHAQMLERESIIRISGKDHMGNYWISGSLPPMAWRTMEEDLKTLGCT
jgi:hypothetical protein